ncbi:L-serine ammonia-lyase [Jatrophihabitans sp. YIM 134969]
MAVSVFDLFSIGIGPSSSHTVGPMRAAARFTRSLVEDGLARDVHRLHVELFGSLGATGHGHGSERAVVAGLEGDEPETVDPSSLADRLAAVRATGRLRLPDGTTVALSNDDLVLHRRKTLPFHPNGMVFQAFGADDVVLREREFYSVGGGFVVDEHSARVVEDSTPVRRPFDTGADLLVRCRESGLPISGVMAENELSWRSAEEVDAGLRRIWAAMQDCVAHGIASEGTLPGGLKVPRRAPALYRHLCLETPGDDPLGAMDWLNLWALAVNEENAAGGRVVTAPTNGAAGVIPAVAHYYRRYVPGATDEGVLRFLLTAAAIGVLYKQNASISGAEVGCQGEVGSACSMAAGGLAEVMGGTPHQVENAAEIGMEHNLGLTCDPVGGLVQIPCIERNAMAAVKAVNAARIALRGDGRHVVSLDKVIRTMRETGADMKVKYKETARGGLAVNVIEC